MEIKTYSVPDVSCEHCKRAIEGAIGGMDGVRRVLVNVERKSVEIERDEAVVSEDAIVARLEDEGYPVAPSR